MAEQPGRDPGGDHPVSGGETSFRPQGGHLYVCATPIGNLDDFSPRAAAVLAAAHLVLAEDTRRLRQLASRYPVGGRVLSCHAHNEQARVAEVLAVLAGNRVVALVTDAGTPGLADPGAQVVAAAAAAGFAVIPIPGPSAVMAALSVSGFPCSSFRFLGFFPRQQKERLATVELLSLEDAVTVFFEGPSRITATLSLLAAHFPERPVLVAREMTKQYETYWRGSLAQVVEKLAGITPRGEYTVVLGRQGDGAASTGAAPGAVAAAQGPAAGDAGASVPVDLLRAEVQLLVEGGYDELEAIRRVARGHGLARQAVYRMVRGGR